MELSWTIQNLDGDTRRCEDGSLATVQLDADRSDAPGAYDEAWDCDRYHGVTPFAIPGGRWRMTLSARCQGGAEALVEVPDPVVRDVREGEVVQLNALLIVLQDGTCR